MSEIYSSLLKETCYCCWCGTKMSWGYNFSHFNQTMCYQCATAAEHNLNWIRSEWGSEVCDFCRKGDRPLLRGYMPSLYGITGLFQDVHWQVCNPCIQEAIGFYKRYQPKILRGMISHMDQYKMYLYYKPIKLDQ